MDGNTQAMRIVGPIALAAIPVALVLAVIYCPPADRVQLGIIAAIGTGVTTMILASGWLMPLAKEARGDRPTATLKYPSMNRMQRRSFANDLDSLSEDRRREAIQAFANCDGSPITGIQCWPTQQCSGLQLAAAEAILREWLEYIKDNPEAPEELIIAELFPLEEIATERDVIKPRVRRLAPPKPQPPSRVVKTLDEWSENVKQKMLNWDVVPLPNEHEESEGEDIVLAPLDRGQFAERMRVKVEETMAYVTDNLAAAKTDYDLLLAERVIHPLLSTLRWEAIATALELRQPDGGPVSIDELREAAESLEPSASPPPDAKPTGGWVSKYRRMRAAGI